MHTSGGSEREILFLVNILHDLSSWKLDEDHWSMTVSFRYLDLYI